jgi:folate-binding protein YgfZ
LTRITGIREAPSVARERLATRQEIAGRTVTMHYGDSWVEYASLRSGAMLVDRGARGRIRIEGPQAAAMLGGLVTNDVTALTPGRGCYAAALSAKGRIIADVRIFAEQASFMVDSPIRATDGWLAMVRKFVNPRVAPYSDVSEETFCLGVFGAHARRILAAASGITSAELEALAPYSTMAASIEGSAVMIFRSPDLGIEGYEMFGVEPSREAVWDALVAAGATPSGLEAFEIARMEAGRPEWGLEIDDNTIPQEANFDELHAISYTKGCYVGQEVVARVHFRGHVNRHLRGLVCGETLPPIGATLTGEKEKAVGDVRSSVESPRLGRIALAMVRREVLPGTGLSAHSESGESRVEMVALPFPS